jgi:hypothetical protein
LAESTSLSGYGCSSDLPAEFKKIQRDGTQETFMLSEDLIASALARNARAMSTRRVTRPPKTAKNQDRSYGYAQDVTISRPGISADGGHAIVAVQEDFSGYTAYLDKQDGIWHVIGRGCIWEA